MRPSGRLVRKVVIGTFVSTFICILVYSVFLPLALSYSRAEWLAFLIRMATVGLVADILATYIVYRLYGRVPQALVKGEALDAAARSKAALAIDGVGAFMLWFGPAAYLSAAIANLLIDAGRNGPPLLGLAVGRVSLAIAWGFVNGIIAARVLDMILVEAKTALGILHPDEVAGRRRSRGSFALRLAVSGFALFLFFVLFAAVTYYSRSIGIARDSIALAAAAMGQGGQALDPARIEALAWESVAAHVPTGLLVFGGLFLISGVLLGVILAEVHSRLRSLERQIEGVAAGERDFSARVRVSSFDDVGRMSGGFNRILDALAGTFVAVRRRTDAIYSDSATISRVSLEAGREAERLASLAVENEAAERERVEEFARATAAFRAVARGIEASASSSAAEARQIESAAEGLKSMADSLAESGAEAARAERAFLELKESAARGAAGVTNSLAAAEAIDEAGKRVWGIASVIEGVADRSNLLAMNASIEAAHAGAAGKGFSVVAKEMKTLAESVAKSAHDISEEVRGVQEINLRAVEAIKGLGAIFDELSRGIGATGEALAAIAGSARRNAAEARDDLALVERLRAFTAELLAASESARSSVADMDGAVARLATSQRRSGEMNEALSAGVRGFAGIFSDLEGRLGSTLEGITGLEAELSRYRLEAGPESRAS